CLTGPGHFLGSDQTLGRMQSDYYYPALADRATPQAWADADTPTLLQTARAKTRGILDQPADAVFGPEAKSRIMAKFPEIRMIWPDIEGARSST
ncbi:MAG: trimethylamine methyltransferase family protein, partial [Pseudomonadota bacterium]